MTDVFDHLERDHRGIAIGLWARRAIVAGCSSSRASRSARAPTIAHPRLVLDEGWVEGMQFNSIEPAPVSEASRDGRVVLSYDRSRPATSCRLDAVRGQPDQRRSPPYGLELDDAEQPVAAPPNHRPALSMDLVLRTIFVFFLILVITRAVGRPRAELLEPFDLILLVVIGDLVQQGVTQSDYSLTGATIVIATVALLTVHRMAQLPLPPPAPAARGRAGRPRRRRPRPRAQPAPPADDARRAGGRGPPAQINSLDDVRFAVLETNGRISFATR